MTITSKQPFETVLRTNEFLEPAAPRLRGVVAWVALLAVSTGVGLAQVPFGSQQVISAAADGASSVFSVDLDRDGDADVLSASSSGDKIAWYENRLDEVTADFGTEQVLSATADGASSVFAIDLDRDGDADVLSASYRDDKIAWYENRLDEASADFGTEKVISPTADGTFSAFAIDLDGDGDADVLSASLFANKIAWYENRLDEVTADFGTEQVLSATADGASSVFAIDLDRDGDADVLSASSNDDKIAWYENRLDEASADFDTEQVISTTADSAYSVFAIDLDGDGDADVLSASRSDDKIAWYENRLDEASADIGLEQVISTTANGAYSVFAIDLDGDGDADVLSASYDDYKIAWYENRLDEVNDFGPKRVISTGAILALSVFAVDLDQDGDADVLSASLFDDKIAWYENRLIHRSADFRGRRLVSTTVTGARRVAAGDVDGDGDLDLFSARTLGLDLHRNEDGGTWTQTSISTNVFAAQEAVYPADLDRDGDLDLLSAGSTFETGVFWHENTTGDGTGTWTKMTISTTTATNVRAADLDGDGDPDALFASGNGDQIAWHENRLDEASADFGSVQSISAAVDNPRSVFAADLDRDGDLDVLSASRNDDKIAWYENTGGGVFHPQQIIISDTANGAESVFAADLDGDGDADALTASIDDDTIAWYANDGTGVFSTPTVVTAAADGANSVWAADMDFDGDLDVVSTSENDDTVSWYENTLGNGSLWTQHRVWSLAYGARHAIAADLDNDGALDIVAASAADDTVAWHRNKGGQFTTQAINTAQESVANGQLEDILAIQVTHNGRGGDTDLELTALEIQLLDSGRNPLASAQANPLIETLRLYRDDGSEVFEESSDFLVSTLSSFALDVYGFQTIPVVDNDPNAHVAAGATGTFFVTFEMTANAENQPVAGFQVFHYSDADEAEDASADCPLSFATGKIEATEVISTALTTASCRAPFDLNLENRTIDTALTCEAGTELRFGSSSVTADGNLTLRAGSSIELESASEAAGTLAIEIDPALLP